MGTHPIFESDFDCLTENMSYGQDTETRLSDAPTDSISSLQFDSSGRKLLCAAWDSKLRIYDAQAGILECDFKSQAPLLDALYEDDNHAWAGGLARKVTRYNIERNIEDNIGTHEEAISCMVRSQEKGCVISGSWDQEITLWDPRTRSRIVSRPQNERVYSMDTVGNQLVVGTAQRKILIWDLRNLDICEQKRDSNLKYQTRVIKCFPNGIGFVMGSIEGRVAVEYFDVDAEVQRKRYAFKCHRQKNEEIEEIYPVNALAFHQKYQTFASGGSDGFVSTWDGFNKKRLAIYRRYPTSISALAFSPNGDQLAIGSSFLDEIDVQGDRYIPEPQIFVRQMLDAEIKPKTMAT